VLGVEIDERMAALARAHGVTVELAAFESWDPAGREFDLITCGQAWHWLDPVAAPVKAAALLRPAGRLALLWNFVEFATSLKRALDAAYEHVAPQLTRASVLRGGGPATIAGHVADLTASARFEPAEVRTYEWVRPYSRADWLALISSHSDHSTLPADQLSELLDTVGAVIDEHGGEIDAHFVTYAIVARRR
jgi:SAM-dependent methyltransferase